MLLPLLFWRRLRTADYGIDSLWDSDSNSISTNLAKTLGLRNTDKLGKTEWKNILKKKAQQLFPYAKVTLATSDALLICEYGRIKENE